MSRFWWPGAPRDAVASGSVVFASALASIVLTRSAQHMATFWFANAVMLVLLLGRAGWAWPVLLAAGGIGNALAHAVAGDGWLLVAGGPACNAMEVLAIATGVRRWIGRDLDLSRPAHLGAFVALAGLAVPAVGSAAAAQVFAASRHALPAALWLARFPADALGYLVFAPLLLLAGPSELRALLRPGRRIEAAVWGAVVATVTVASFLQNSYPILFVPAAALAPVAVRLGPAGTVVGIGFVAITAAVATLHGHGPVLLGTGGPVAHGLMLQGFVAATALSNLPLNALLSQHARLQARLRDANARLTSAEKMARMGHWRIELPSRTLTWSDGVYDLHGLDPARHTPTIENAVAHYHPDDRAEVARLIAYAARWGTGHAANLRIVRADGKVRDVQSRGICEKGPDGRVTAVFGTLTDVTDLRRVERAAAEGEKRYRLLADNATDMITRMDLSGRRLFVSPASRDLLGFEPDALVGTSPLDMIHADDAPGLACLFENFAAGRTDRAINVNRLRHRDGRWIWVEASLRLLRTPAGAPAGVVGAVRDITARKQTDEALRESEARYRLLADNATDMITQMDLSGRRLFVSPGSQALLGYQPEDLVGTLRQAFVHPDDEPALKLKLDELAAGRADQTATVNRVRHRDGRWIWVEASVKLLRDEGGRPQGVVSALRDVTVRREAELALAASEARYRVLAEATSDVITQLDLDLRRSYVSPACRRVLGFEPNEMLGVRPSARMHPEDTDAVRAVAHRLAAGAVEGDRATVTYRSLHRQGNWVWLETVMTLVRDAVTGAPASLICSMRDVSERQRVARHLERAKVQAEAAAHAKAEFVANMSHELRTPLTGILGVHDLLRTDAGLTAGQRRLIDLASDAGRSLLAIVNDVLDFSKIDAGRLDLETVPFDLDALLLSCVDLARGQLNDKPVTLSVARVPSTLGWVAGDPTRIRQIVLNLLTNAVKFTDRGQVTLRTAYRDASRTVRVEVTDTGPGLPPDRIRTLFGRFTQADASTTRRYGGTGLGLAICRHLTDLMGGRIDAEPAPGGGSTFWFELPLDRHDGLGPDRARDARGQAAPGRPRLLLAEDSPVNAEIVTAMLTTRGYLVTCVGDGAAAVAAARGPEPFDLILMDLQMPVMDGLDATRAIRARERETGAARVPIVGFTANALAEDAERCLAVGMDAHVAKPVDWPRLFAVLDDLGGASEPAGPGNGRGPDLDGVLEGGILEELAGLIGHDRVASMLARFVDDLRARLAAVAAGGEAELSDAVHVLVATAGQLGFRELGALCVEADALLRSGAGFDRLDELRRAADRAAAAAARSAFARAA